MGPSEKIRQYTFEREEKWPREEGREENPISGKPRQPKLSLLHFAAKNFNKDVSGDVSILRKSEKEKVLKYFALIWAVLGDLLNIYINNK